MSIYSASLTAIASPDRVIACGVHSGECCAVTLHARSEELTNLAMVDCISSVIDFSSGDVKLFPPAIQYIDSHKSGKQRCNTADRTYTSPSTYPV